MAKTEGGRAVGRAATRGGQENVKNPRIGPLGHREIQRNTWEGTPVDHIE